jgi:hypothetical protein
MNVLSFSFDNHQLSATIQHNVIVYSDDYNTRTVIFNRFPLVENITKTEIVGLKLKQSNKVTYNV